MSVALCDHRDFNADVRVVRLEDSGRFVAEVSIRCAQCGVRCRWLGVDAGLSWTNPMSSVDAFTLFAPIEPDAHLTSWMAEHSKANR